MSADHPTPLNLAMTWAALVVAACLFALGVYWYGWSMQVHQRFWQDIFDRAHGPMTFRFFLQPAMAAIAALPDGLRDARLGHKSFFWTALCNPTKQGGRLREGLISTARVMLLGISMDAIYQYKVFDQFYPVEALMMAILLAVIPYFVLRWLFETAARWWIGRAHGATRL